MTDKRRSRPPLYHTIEVSQDLPLAGRAEDGREEQVVLLREILAAQDRQNELLEELVGQVGAVQRQRQNELGQWRQANPQLARTCRKAADALTRVQTEFLAALTREINENSEMLIDGEFILNEFVDRYGPRMAHLNGLVQMLSQLSSTPSPASTHHST